MKTPLPDKRIRLALWLVLYGLPIDADVENDGRWQDACAKHLKWDWRIFAAIRQDFPRHWQRMLDKRARRLAYAKKHGGCPPGWTPSAPGEIPRPAPLAALRMRCKTEEGRFLCLMRHVYSRRLYDEEEHSSIPG